MEEDYSIQEFRDFFPTLFTTVAETELTRLLLLATTHCANIPKAREGPPPDFPPSLFAQALYNLVAHFITEQSLDSQRTRGNEDGDGAVTSIKAGDLQILLSAEIRKLERSDPLTITTYGQRYTYIKRSTAKIFSFGVL